MIIPQYTRASSHYASHLKRTQYYMSAFPSAFCGKIHPPALSVHTGNQVIKVSSLTFLRPHSPSTIESYWFIPKIDLRPMNVPRSGPPPLHYHQLLPGLWQTVASLVPCFCSCLIQSITQIATQGAFRITNRSK